MVHSRLTITSPCQYHVPNVEGGLGAGTFTSPTVPNSDLPGLIGLEALERMRAVLDFITGTLHLMGPGDHAIADVLPPGTTSYQLSKAPSGHLLLPCTHYDKISQCQAGC